MYLLIYLCLDSAENMTSITRRLSVEGLQHLGDDRRWRLPGGYLPTYQPLAYYRSSPPCHPTQLIAGPSPWTLTVVSRKHPSAFYTPPPPHFHSMAQRLRPSWVRVFRIAYLTRQRDPVPTVWLMHCHEPRSRSPRRRTEQQAMCFRTVTAGNVKIASPWAARLLSKSLSSIQSVEDFVNGRPVQQHCLVEQQFDNGLAGSSAAIPLPCPHSADDRPQSVVEVLLSFHLGFLDKAAGGWRACYPTTRLLNGGSGKDSQAINKDKSNNTRPENTVLNTTQNAMRLTSRQGKRNTKGAEQRQGAIDYGACDVNFASSPPLVSGVILGSYPRKSRRFMDQTVAWARAVSRKPSQDNIILPESSGNGAAQRTAMPSHISRACTKRLPSWSPATSRLFTLWETASCLECQQHFELGPLQVQSVNVCSRRAPQFPTLAKLWRSWITPEPFPSPSKSAGVVLQCFAEVSCSRDQLSLQSPLRERC